MTRSTFSRRSFFGLLGAAPLAVPTIVRAVDVPAVLASTVDTSALDDLVRRATAARLVLDSINPTARKLALRLSCLESESVSSSHPEAS